MSQGNSVCEDRAWLSCPPPCSAPPCCLVRGHGDCRAGDPPVDSWSWDADSLPPGHLTDQAWPAERALPGGSPAQPCLPLLSWGGGGAGLAAGHAGKATAGGPQGRGSPGLLLRGQLPAIRFLPEFSIPPCKPHLPRLPSQAVLRAACGFSQSSLWTGSLLGPFLNPGLPRPGGSPCVPSTHSAGGARALGAGSGAPGPACRGCKAAESPLGTCRPGSLCPALPLPCP